MIWPARPLHSNSLMTAAIAWGSWDWDTATSAMVLSIQTQVKADHLIPAFSKSCLQICYWKPFQTFSSSSSSSNLIKILGLCLPGLTSNRCSQTWHISDRRQLSYRSLQCRLNTSVSLITTTCKETLAALHLASLYLCTVGSMMTTMIHMHPELHPEIRPSPSRHTFQWRKLTRAASTIKCSLIWPSLIAHPSLPQYKVANLCAQSNLRPSPDQVSRHSHCACIA